MFGGYQQFGIGKSHVALVAPLKGGGFAVGPDRQGLGKFSMPRLRLGMYRLAQAWGVKVGRNFSVRGF